MTHPAKFSDAILERAVAMLDARLDGSDLPMPCTVLDPFAGIGKGVDYLRARGYAAEGVDLEPADAWGEADVSSHVRVGNALALDYDDGAIDVVFTSPTYGNRFADSFRLSDSDWETPGRRHGYTHEIQWASGDRERKLHPDNTGAMPWGPRYREVHEGAWAEVRRVLAPGGLFLLNISDHYRDKVPVGVAAWHVKTIVKLGFEWIGAEAISTPRMGRGANGAARCEVEWLHLFKRVEV